MIKLKILKHAKIFFNSHLLSRGEEVYQPDDKIAKIWIKRELADAVPIAGIKKEAKAIILKETPIYGKEEDVLPDETETEPEPEEEEEKDPPSESIQSKKTYGIFNSAKRRSVGRPKKKNNSSKKGK